MKPGATTHPEASSSTTPSSLGADGLDAPAGHGHIGHAAGLAAPVHDRPATNHQVS